MRGLRVRALLTDYDGTIAHEGSQRVSSRVPLRVLRPLQRIGSLIPVAIVSSKDYEFLRPRTPFARAWACVSGLEIRLHDGGSEVGELRGDVERALLELGHLCSLFEVELKKIGERAAGLCLDWSHREMPKPSQLWAAISVLRRHGLKVLLHAHRKYLDAYAGEPDKGRAVERLKALLGVGQGVLYLGDSEQDNAAFERADIGIGVLHGQPAERLRCDYFVRYGQLHLFLRALLHNGLIFKRDMPGLVRR